MIRKTSKESYNQVLQSGILSKMRINVYKGLYRYGPCTGRELCELAGKDSVSSNVRARLNELVKLGCVSEVGTKKCSISGKNAILFVTNDNIPTELIRPKTKKQKKNDVLTEIESIKIYYKQFGVTKKDFIRDITRIEKLINKI